MLVHIVWMDLDCPRFHTRYVRDKCLKMTLSNWAVPVFSFFGSKPKPTAITPYSFLLTHVGAVGAKADAPITMERVKAILSFMIAVLYSCISLK